MANRSEDFLAGHDGAKGSAKPSEPTVVVPNRDGEYFHPTTGMRIGLGDPAWKEDNLTPGTRRTTSRKPADLSPGEVAVGSKSAPKFGQVQVDHPDVPGAKINLTLNNGNLVFPHREIDPRTGSQNTLSEAQKEENALHLRAFADHSAATAAEDAERAKAEALQSHSGEFANLWKKATTRQTVRSDGSTSSLGTGKGKSTKQLFLDLQTDAALKQARERTTVPSAVESRLASVTANNGVMNPKPREIRQQILENHAILTDHLTGGIAIARKKGLGDNDPLVQGLFLAKRHLDSAAKSLAQHQELSRARTAKGSLGPDVQNSVLHDAVMSVGAAHDTLSHPNISEHLGLPGTSAQDLVKNAVHTHAYKNFTPFKKEGKLRNKVKLGRGETAVLPSGREVSTTVNPAEVMPRVDAAVAAQSLGLMTGIDPTAVAKVKKRTKKLRAGERLAAEGRPLVESGQRGGSATADYVKDEEGKTEVAGKDVVAYRPGEGGMETENTPNTRIDLPQTDFTKPTGAYPTKKNNKK